MNNTKPLPYDILYKKLLLNLSGEPYKKKFKKKKERETNRPIVNATYKNIIMIYLVGKYIWSFIELWLI